MRGCSRFLAPLVCLAMAGLPGFADDRPSYTIYRAGGPITIDGRLDEPAWFAAPSVGPFRFAWWKAGKKEQTVAKMLWDDEHLYVAFLCQDAHISGVQTRHDTSVWLDDCDASLRSNKTRRRVQLRLVYQSFSSGGALRQSDRQRAYRKTFLKRGVPDSTSF